MSVPTSMNQFGDQTLIFGLTELTLLKAAIGNIVSVVSAKYDEEPEVSELAEGEEGEGISMALQKPTRWMIKITIDGMIKDVAAYNALSSFTFKGRFYIIDNRSRSEENKQWAKVTIPATSYINITS